MNVKDRRTSTYCEKMAQILSVSLFWLHVVPRYSTVRLKGGNESYFVKIAKTEATTRITPRASTQYKSQNPYVGKIHRFSMHRKMLTSLVSLIRGTPCQFSVKNREKASVASTRCTVSRGKGAKAARIPEDEEQSRRRSTRFVYLCKRKKY